MRGGEKGVGERGENGGEEGGGFAKEVYVALLSLLLNLSLPPHTDPLLSLSQYHQQQQNHHPHLSLLSTHTKKQKEEERRERERERGRGKKGQGGGGGKDKGRRRRRKGEREEERERDRNREREEREEREEQYRMVRGGVVGVVFELAVVSAPDEDLHTKVCVYVCTHVYYHLHTRLLPLSLTRIRTHTLSL